MGEEENKGWLRGALFALAVMHTHDNEGAAQGLFACASMKEFKAVADDGQDLETLEWIDSII